MSDCVHKASHEATISREFLGRTFKAKAQVCSNCGAELWDKELNDKFTVWVAGLSKPKVQFKISAAAKKCLDELMQKYFPKVTHAAMMRAMVFLYMVLLNEEPEVNKLFNEAFESDYFKGFEAQPTEEVLSGEVKPLLYYDLVSWANIYGIKPNEFASDAFHVMMSIFIAKDEHLQNFWLNEILPKLQDMVLKAS